MRDEFAASFVEEARELLLLLEKDLLNLEVNPQDKEIINGIFRVMHTLKGAAGMCGFTNIQDLTHEFEGIYSSIREGEIIMNTDLIDLTLKGKDVILAILNDEPQNEKYDKLIKEIQNAKSDGSPDGTMNQIVIESNKSSNIKPFVIFFIPDKEVFTRGLNPDKAIDELRNSGQIHIILHEKKSSWETQKTQKICQTSWEIYINTTLELLELEEIFLFYDDQEFQIFELSNNNHFINPKLTSKLRKLYKDRVIPEQHIKECLVKNSIIRNKIEPSVSQKTKEFLIDVKSVESGKSDTESTINVSSYKLDELMNLVSELVTMTATLEACDSRMKDSELSNVVENIEKLTKKFRINALDLRLVPVGTLLSRFKRQIRDLSKDLNKQVNFIIEGQDVEIDKTILKSIEGPLLHIIRNSIDHGIESAEERIEKTKSPEGLLKIAAFTSGSNVIIQVQDDGRGINLERVKECAIKQGYIQHDQVIAEGDLLNLILEPGFSTKDNISMVSGRGVGMDVVKKELNAVGGSLEIFTEKNLGTSITMKLPTTLTIVDTLMIEVDNTHILIPMLDIEYCYKEKGINLFKKDAKYVQFKNGPIPVVSLREEFKYSVNDDQDLMVVVINKFERKYAIVADRIIGEYQAVIKPLGRLFSQQPFFSGGSIMVDGKLALILDTNFLFNKLTKN
jgi:two-component system, chemotaxis family, sensor kinase CheA